MATKTSLRPMKRLVTKRHCGSTPSFHLCLRSPPIRTMATGTDLPIEQVPYSIDRQSSSGLTTSASANYHSYLPKAITTTIHHFPTMEPLRHETFAEHQLYLPIRKDILHRAVIFEGDRTRSGTANTKWRDEVHGSHRKVHPQKGTGRARAGDKQSPIRRGGGVAFGPKPRDFSTKLPRKIYDLAWRTALSYRYKKGELIIVDHFKDLAIDETWWLKKIFDVNGWGHAHGRSMLVGLSWVGLQNLREALDLSPREGKGKTVEEVDVKNLLETGRVIMELRALRYLLRKHSHDVVPSLHVPQQPLLDPTVHSTI